jgi:hypothetical protein
MSAPGDEATNTATFLWPSGYLLVSWDGGKTHVTRRNGRGRGILQVQAVADTREEYTDEHPGQPR